MSIDIRTLSNGILCIGYLANRAIEVCGKMVLPHLDSEYIKNVKETLYGMNLYGYNIPTMIIPGFCSAVDHTLSEKASMDEMVYSVGALPILMD